MENIFWNFPSEQIYDRLEELYEYLQNFPDSKLSSAIRNEIDYLESLL